MKNLTITAQYFKRFQCQKKGICNQVELSRFGLNWAELVKLVELVELDELVEFDVMVELEDDFNSVTYRRTDVVTCIQAIS